MIQDGLLVRYGMPYTSYVDRIRLMLCISHITGGIMSSLKAHPAVDQPLKPSTNTILLMLVSLPLFRSSSSKRPAALGPRPVECPNVFCQLHISHACVGKS